ncbi:MAG: hypothetical protein ACPGVZ_20100 [Myxococcota bacterium]
MSRLMLLSLVPCLLLAPVANGEEPVDSLGGPWAGTWLLDPEASDPVEPMLVLLKTPWIARKAAAAMTPTMRITALGHGGLRVINENPIRTTNEEIFIDGVKRERLDPLDRKVVRSATLSATGQLIVRNWNHVEEDEVVEVTSTWSLAGNTLEISNVIQGEDDALVIRRVFRKQ